MYISNAFSLSMIAPRAHIDVSPLTAEEVAALPLESAIGHADTAKVVGGLIGVDLSANRANVFLKPGEKMVVAQYIGPRLPEGATQLPDGARIEFRLVEIKEVALNGLVQCSACMCIIRLGNSTTLDGQRRILG